MADVRAELVAQLREAIALARGAATAGLAAANEELRTARRRLLAIRRQQEDAPRLLAEERDRRLAQAEADHRGDVNRNADAAALAASAYAREPEGASWVEWRARSRPRAAEARLLRVGEVILDPPPLQAVPALIPLLDHNHLAIEGKDGTDGVLAGVLLRIIGSTEPGAVRLYGYDPERLGGGLAPFAPLAPAGLLTFVGPGGLAGLLDSLVEEIRRINESVLAGEHASLRQYAASTRRRPEPWRIAVLLGSGTELSKHEQAQLSRVFRAGVHCGVHVIACGFPVPKNESTVVVRVTGPATATTTFSKTLPIRLDPAPDVDLVTRTCRVVGEQYAAGPRPTAFADLLPDPEKFWTQSSEQDLTAPVGEGPDGRLVHVTLGDNPPHAIIGGPSGTGKTNLIYAWMGALSARYAPSELEFYLLDFKEGVSFARFAPGRRDQSWLPHVRLVGINVNTDREFGLALLRFLGEELRRRAEAAKRFEVTKLSELRAEDPSGHWPRIVAVVDEFQVLLAGRDALATEAVNLLEDLARRGRSQGIHLILASQDLRGIEALWGRSGLVAQFTLRIAMPKARKVLQENNDAAEQIPRHHAVVNSDSGAVEANRIVQVPEAGNRETWAQLQSQLWRMRPAELAAPRLFDGDTLPRFPGPLEAGRHRTAVVGERIDVVGRPATLRVTRSPGRNLAVLGTGVEEASAVLASAARSLAWPGPWPAPRFSVVCLDHDAEPYARDLHASLPAAGWYDEDNLIDLLSFVSGGLAADTPTTAPHILVMYAVDAAVSRLSAPAEGGSGHTHLRHILHSGPDRNVHVLGWWRGVGRLRDDLGGTGARFDAIGAWVALDIHGGDLSPMFPQPGGPVWYPRPWRGLFFDRAVHRVPEVIIPYGGPG